MVLNSGTKDEKVLAAEIRYADREADLVLLRVKDAKELPVLRLGADDTLGELSEVIACGFPFGEALAIGKANYPAISINPGSVTALRKKDGQLHRIQLDVALNPGNSGGPVLDRTGKVVGVVVSGVKGSGVNFAIPVSHVSRFMDRVDMRFIPPTINAKNVRQPSDFEVQAMSILESEKSLNVELVLGSADEKQRRHNLVQKSGAHQTSVRAFPVIDGPTALRLSVSYGNDSVAGSADDRAFRVGDQELWLSEVGSIVTAKDQSVKLVSGKVIAGKVTGLDQVPINVGGKAYTFDLMAATRVLVKSPSRILAVPYAMVATRDGKEVGRLQGLLLNEDLVQKAYLCDLTEFEVRVGFGKFGKHGSLGYEDRESIVKGVKATKGLSMAPVDSSYSTVKYRLDKNAFSFRSGVGLFDSLEESFSPCTFEVLGDGKSLWKSKPIKQPQVTDACDLDVGGVEVLELRVNIPGNYGRARAIWVDPFVLKERE